MRSLICKLFGHKPGIAGGSAKTGYFNNCRRCAARLPVEAE